MKILNLYAGIGGNRKLWGDEHDITAVEQDENTAKTYQYFYPKDTVVVDDAHQYLLDHFKEFDFIWSSPPCPTHSKLSTGLAGWNIYRYPDMKLYEEIIFLKHFYKGNWVVENVTPYYTPLIPPQAVLDRHYFWSNQALGTFIKKKRPFTGELSNATVKELEKYHDILLPDFAKNKRLKLRDMVVPELGLHVFSHANIKQGALL